MKPLANWALNWGPILTDGAFPREHPSIGAPTATWAYRDAHGVPLCAVYRFDFPDGKKVYLPFDLSRSIWKAPDPRPLYGLDQLAANQGRVILVEGEKCADALNGVGVLSVSCFGGANAPHKNDLAPLKGRDVVIWPDADEAGEKYALKVAELLQGVAYSVSIIAYRLGALRPSSLRPGSLRPDPLIGIAPYKGWDAADAIDQGWDTLRIRRLTDEAIPYDTYIRNVTDAVPYTYTETDRKIIPYTGTDKVSAQNTYTYTEAGTELAPSTYTLPEWSEPDMSVLNPVAVRPTFPIEIVGPGWGQWLKDAAESVSAPVDYVGTALLVTAASLIGNARRVSPWGGWKEPCILWAALVGSPSSGKSPAMDPVLNMIAELERDYLPDFDDALRQYETEKLAAELTTEKWRQESKEAAQKGFPIPTMPEAAEAPQKPERTRLKVSDTTPEALANILAGQPKGVLSYRDELSGWLGNFDKYGGKGERPFWIEAYGGRPYVMDRVKHGGKPVEISHLAVSVLGGIQPDRFETLMKRGDDDGLTSRFLYTCPIKVRPQRPDRIPNQALALQSFRKLAALRMAESGADTENENPVTLSFTGDAADLFEDWRIKHSDHEPEGIYASWWGKCPGMVLRLSLVLQLLWWSIEEDYSAPENISFTALDSALRLIEVYFKPMARIVYNGNTVNRERVLAANLAQAILDRRRERINARDVYRDWHLPGLSDADAVHTAIEILVDAGWLRAVENYRPQGGRLKGDFDVSPKLCQN